MTDVLPGMNLVALGGGLVLVGLTLAEWTAQRVRTRASPPA
ncbi:MULTISPECIES: hypothetical protein [unclassified Streptomyces]|jgi:hypothetical protein|nr:hypothetical protein [Streptomyces sp.]